jgi:GR25 family glycosyltransferase involved in LPS biosynthesis
MMMIIIIMLILFNSVAASPILNYPPSSCPLRGITTIHVMNLKRMPERLAAFEMRSGLDASQYHHFEAVDFTALRLDVFQYIAGLFNRNIFGSGTPMIAEALSHLTLWQHIATTQNEMHLVFTDDAAFVDG